MNSIGTILYKFFWGITDLPNDHPMHGVNPHLGMG